MDSSGAVLIRPDPEASRQRARLRPKVIGYREDGRPIYEAGGASGYTGTQAEILYAYFGAATTSVPGTTPGTTITATFPPIIVPAGYMKNANSSISSALRLEMGGLMTATATIPTWQFVLYASVATTTAPAFATSGINLGVTAAFTPVAATNYVWEAVVNIGLRTLALGAGSTVTAFGRFMCNAFAIVTTYTPLSGNFVSMPGNGAYTPSATWDTSQAYVLWPALILGAATAGNTVTVEYAKLWGEN